MRNQKTKMLLGLALSVAVLLSACATPAPPAMPTPEPAPTETPQPPPTATEEPEVVPTDTPEPTPVPPTATPEPTEVVPTETPEPPAEEATDAPPLWAADGVVSEGEYTDQADFGDMRLWWRNDSEHLYVAMEGDTAGWIAIGINPERGMQGADYILGYVVGGEASIWDAYGTAPAGATHPPDEELGGTDDIVTFSGVEEGGVTRFEVQIPLDSGDDYDQALTPGETYPLIIAIGGSDEFNAYHQRYARGELVLAAEQ